MTRYAGNANGDLIAITPVRTSLEAYFVEKLQRAGETTARKDRAKARVAHIASNTFREAVRDRVLYNLIAFALLLSGAAILVGQISIDIEKLVVINLGLTAVSLFGVVIAIFIGIGLVSKEIEKRTLYTVLSRPVRRWEFIVGKFFGLAGTLVVNTFFMAIGVFAALFYVSLKFVRADGLILIALYFIILEFLIICSLALLFSSFSSPLLGQQYLRSRYSWSAASLRTCATLPAWPMEFRTRWQPVRLILCQIFRPSM